MPRKAGPKRRKQWNDERLFATVVIIWSLLFAAGYWLLLFVMNNRENNPPVETSYIPEDTVSRLIPPAHPRQLANFTLTDRTERAVTRSDLKGKILIVDFLFTGCSLTCPP